MVYSRESLLCLKRFVKLILLVKLWALKMPCVLIFISLYVSFFFGCVCRGLLPVPVAVQSKAKVFGRSPAEIAGSNPTGGMDVCLL
jgi:hypothetical protein